MNAEPVRTIVADDHPLFRHGIGALLRDSPETELVGEASSGEEALRLVDELTPHVVAMDISMPGMGGIHATEAITRTHPAVAVLLLTMMDDDEAIHAGIRGYVLKGSQPTDILQAILTVARGHAIFGAEVVAGLERLLTRGPPLRVALPELTPRQREILTLMATGDGNAAIARRLGLSEKTVRNNVSNIFTKLRVTNRTAAVVRAHDAGVGKP